MEVGAYAFWPRSEATFFGYSGHAWKDGCICFNETPPMIVPARIIPDDCPLTLKICLASDRAPRSSKLDPHLAPPSRPSLVSALSGFQSSSIGHLD